jgi:hypothetical protein
MSTLGFNLVTMPNFPTPSQVEWTGANLVAESSSQFTKQAQVFDWNVAWWEAAVTMPPMIDSRFRAWSAFIASCSGNLNAFMLGDPVQSQPMGTGGTGAVSGANQTGRTLVTTFGSGAVLPGDIIQVNFRMFRVLSNSSGTLGIWPPLKESPANAATITTSNPQGLFRMKANTAKWSENPWRQFGLSFQIVEAYGISI